MGAYSAATTDESEERAPSKHVQVACTLARAGTCEYDCGMGISNPIYVRYTDISSRFARFVVSRYDMPMRKWLHAFLETVAYGFFTLNYMRNCFSNWFAPLRAPCSGLWSMSEYRMNRMADGRNAAQLAPHALPTKYPRYLARHHSPSLAFPLELSTAADESSKVRLCPRVLTSMRISIRISGGASLKAWLAHLRGADHASSRSRP